MATKTGIYKVQGGKRVELTPSQVKNYILKINNWDEDTYNKERFKLKNKLRSYEAFQAKSGMKVEAQSPVQLLYKEAKAKQQYKDSYQPSFKIQQIKGFTSYGSKKAIAKAYGSERVIEKQKEKYIKYVDERFKGFIANNEVAQKIYKEIKDPVKREKALADYANKVHAVIEERETERKAQAIPIGESYGSDISIDFDIKDYIWQVNKRGITL